MHGLKQETPGSKNQLYHNNMILKNISKLINN